MSGIIGLLEVGEEDYGDRNMLDDLQLAAELGKTLLERNKELENALKQSQGIVEDQLQEIEYLTKQSVALREVNDSRLRIYEQLEVSIQDLERANHRLVLENSAEKKHIKSLNVTIEGLETKNDELLTTIDDLRLQVDVLKKKAQRTAETSNYTPPKKEIVLRRVERSFDETDGIISPNQSTDNIKECKSASTPKNNKTDKSEKANNSMNKIAPETKTNENDRQEADHIEEVSNLLTQLRESKTLCNRELRKVAELEEQLATVQQQNQSLENQIIKLHHKNEDMKSMHEELTTLEEVRQGQLCSRCLRNADDSHETLPEDDDSSMLENLITPSPRRSSFTLEVQEHPEHHSSPIISKQETRNHYKELVEKYEALFENHRPVPNRKDQFMSLQEEMQLSGDFHINTKDTDEESGHGDSLGAEKQVKKATKTVSHTPTDFSEAETSSSGFAEETSTKATQTDGKVGSFLCTIADGEDCKFSIYDDASPIDSRFRKRPEYRELFKEIFTILKKAAETKDEDEELPALDDFTPTKIPPKVPPVTPMNDSFPDFPDDDSQSIVSSTLSEQSTSQPTTVIENMIQAQQEIEPAYVEDQKSQEPVLRPLIRQSFDYLSIETRKRSSSRKKNRCSQRSDSPVTHIIGSPKISYSNRPNSGRRRREMKQNPPQEQESTWNGNSLQFWSSTTRANVSSPTPSQGSEKVFEFKPSSASQEIRKLKSLDKSYAEVLKLGEGRKREQRYRRK